MRLKVYRAQKLADAMGRIRAEMGPDALILATRRVADGVEITAALEPEETGELWPPPLPIAPRGRPGADAATRAALAFHRVPEALSGRVSGALEESLAALLSFGALDLERRAPPLLIAGPPGAGKTLTVARLATRLVMLEEAPLVITADGKRAGAAEQLAAFTRLLGIGLIVASQPVTLARALARRVDGAPVLIDTPGIDPLDPVQRGELVALADAVGARIALVLPAGMDAEESADLACAFAEAGAGVLIATRIDIARRLGNVLAAADRGGLALAEAGIGPGAADGLTALTPAFLAHRLLAAHTPSSAEIEA